MDDTTHQGKHCDQVEIQVHPTVTLGSGVPVRVSETAKNAANHTGLA